MDESLEILVHSIKANRYRFIKTTDGTSEEFGAFRLKEQTRTPKEIVLHMRDLVNKARQIISNGNLNCPSARGYDTFLEEKQQLLESLTELTLLMRIANIGMETSKRLLQGPILDMATHVGQLAMLRGLHGNNVTKESYFDAEI